MADYNIYLHAIGTGTETAINPTTPWSQRGTQGISQTQPWESGDGDIDNISNPKQLVQAAKTYASSIFPKFAAAAVIVRIAQKLIEIGKSYYSVYEQTTGDYRLTTEVSNVRSLVSAFLDPISAQVNWHQTQIKLDVENKKRQQERVLLGDSVINSYTNRGV